MSVGASPLSLTHHRITPTVIGLIVLFTLLVGPSEILALLRLKHLLADSRTATSYDAYQSAVVITNFLLLVNFAVNFVLCTLPRYTQRI